MDPQVKKAYVRKAQIGVFSGVACFFILPFVFHAIGIAGKAALVMGVLLFFWGGIMLALSKGRSPYWGLLGITLIGVGLIEMLNDQSVLEEWKKAEAKVNLKARAFALFITIGQFPIFIISLNLFKDESSKYVIDSFTKAFAVTTGILIILGLLFTFTLSCPWCKKRVSLTKDMKKDYRTCEHCAKNWRF